MFLKCCVNGDRQRAEHPALPVTPVEIANALKSFAKHGERVVKTIGADVAHGVDPLAWTAMEAEFARIMKAAKSGTLMQEAATSLGSSEA